MTKTGPHKRNFLPDRNAAAAAAQALTLSRKTCEGCAGLRQYPRPMCREERSPHFRTARDTYHERCGLYTVQHASTEPGAPSQPPRAMNHAQVVVRGGGALVGVSIIIGDVREKLRELPSDSVDCVVTSPPYWGLRDYGVEGQIGLERTLGEHLAVMVDVFNEVRRVMKPEATLWLNYGDCYATKPNGRSAADTKAAGNDDRTFRDKPFSTVGPINPPEPGQPFPPQHGRRGGGNNFSPELKPKDLCMVPNRLAIALQEAGWWVRSEIIWAKPNPMPDSSGKYRPSTAHEKIFMLAKSGRYYYDQEAVRQPSSEASVARVARDKPEHGSKRANGGTRPDRPMKAVRPRALTPRHEGHIVHTTLDDYPRGEGRFLRNYEPAPVQVWEIGSRAFKDAHFATFPPELAERCIKAGCPKGGVVLDPFGGAGTTGMVADRLQRNAILIELNPEYAAMARDRIDSDTGRLAHKEVAPDGSVQRLYAGNLFEGAE